MSRAFALPIGYPLNTNTKHFKEDSLMSKYCDTQDVVNALVDGGKIVRIIPAVGDIIRYAIYDGNGYIGHSAGVVYWYLQKQGHLRKVGEPTKDTAGNTYETYKYIFEGTARRISRLLDKQK